MRTLLLLTAFVLLDASCMHGTRPEEPSEPTPPPNALTRAAGPNESCKSDDQCQGGLVCEGCGKDDRVCLPGCRGDGDCQKDERCQQVTCIRCPCPPLCGRAG
jgi:hypothetical protein